MSQKQDILDMLEDGKGYDEIEDSTGSKRSYIRSIAVSYRKGDSQNEGNEPEDEPEETPETPTKEPGMNFIDDVTPPESKDSGEKLTSGKEYHKAWIKAGKYQCGTCGATIGRTTDFCPHCGKQMAWEGIE